MKKYFLLLSILFFMGCQTAPGNVGRMQNFAVPSMEADWIRNGEAIEFEGEYWYPIDGVESLTDVEMHVLGEYRSVTFFIEKIDVRPYNRLYTKFGKNRFRFFEKKE